MFERFADRSSSPIFVETDKDASISRELLEPHYSDPRFSWKMHSVYLDPQYKAEEDRSGYSWVKQAGYDYSDRIDQRYGHDAIRLAYQGAKEVVENHRSIRFFEEFLRRVYGKPNLRLVHLITGVNVSNGYPYKLFGTVEPAEIK